MLDLSARKVYGALAEQCVGGDAKADKVENATSGHLAGLDSNGNLTDSGVSPTEDVTVEGNPITFDSPFEQDAKSVVVSVKPIQTGSGTPSPDNIRPISGIDEVEIGVSGKNLLPLKDETKIEQGVTISPIYNNDGRHIGYDLDGTATGSFDYWFAGSLGLPAGIARYITLGLENAIQNFQLVYSPVYSGVQTNAVITDAFDGAFLKIGSGAVFNHVKIYPMLCLNSESDKSFEPYNPNSHTTTIPLPSTLYGGTVDVTNGIDTATYGYIASYNGETLPGAWISDRDVYTGSNSPTIGAEVAYELATPTTISFDPTDVELLEGTNVVTTNAEKVAVTYSRSLWQDIDALKTDTEGKLDKSNVADVEGDTASRPYSVNEFMLRSDGFYRVTAPIAQNASITASNTTKTTIGAVLTALLNA